MEFKYNDIAIYRSKIFLKNYFYGSAKILKLKTSLLNYNIFILSALNHQISIYYLYIISMLQFTSSDYHKYISLQDNNSGMSSDYSDSQNAKSCEGKLNQSPYISQISQYENPKFKKGRAARSYKSDDGEGWDQMTKEEKKETIQRWGQQFKDQKRPQIDEIKRVKDEGKFIGDRKFTDQIIDSESVSLHDSARSSVNQNNDRVIEHEEPLKEAKRDAQPRKLKYFNIMLVGASSTGKTTYMKCFLGQYKHLNNEHQILDPTTQIKEYTLNPNRTHLNLESKIIDTPGYKASTFPYYMETVTNQILKRNQNYKQQIQKTMRQSAIYERNQRIVVDTRIHCCLLFFRGPRIHKDDWELLKKLENITNIIPVIAKGDSYTISEVQHLKKIIIQRAQQETVQWFNANEYIRQKYPECLNLLQNGPYGPSPPFMVVGSTSKIDRNGLIKLSRQYKWGTCYIQNQAHTEFTILNKLLIDYFRDGLVKLTEIKMKALMQKENQKRMEGSSLNKIMLGIFAGATLTAAWLYLKNKE